MRASEYFILGLFLFLGLFSLIASIFNVDWYFRSRRAATFVNWFGLTGARIFYGLLGVALIGCALMGFFSWR